MKKLDIKKVIEKAIKTNKQKIIKSLGKANINVSSTISDKLLFELVMHELEKGNPDVILHVGNELNNIFDMSPIEEVEVFSNNNGLAIPKGGFKGVEPMKTPSDTWWSKNKGNVLNSALTFGSSLLGNIFGKKDKPPTTIIAPQKSSDGSSQMLMMMQQQQRADEIRRREDEEKRKNTMMIIGIVGGVLLIGTVITVVAFKTGK